MKKERIPMLHRLFIYADSDNPDADLGRIKTAWRSCRDRSELEWVLHQTEHNINKLRRLACLALQDMPIIDTKTTYDFLQDPRSRETVEIAKKYATGTASADELNAALAGALAAQTDAGEHYPRAEYFAALAAAHVCGSEYHTVLAVFDNISVTAAAAAYDANDTYPNRAYQDAYDTSLVTQADFFHAHFPWDEIKPALEKYREKNLELRAWRENQKAKLAARVVGKSQ